MPSFIRALKVPGIIISATRIRAKATSVAAKCKSCGALKHIPCVGPFGGAVLPMRCDKNGQAAPEGGDDDCGRYILISTSSVSGLWYVCVCVCVCVCKIAVVVYVALESTPRRSRSQAGCSSAWNAIGGLLCTTYSL